MGRNIFNRVNILVSLIMDYDFSDEISGRTTDKHGLSKRTVYCMRMAVVLIILFAAYERLDGYLNVALTGYN